MTYTINPNDAFNSIEIAFDGKPSEAVRDALKALRFRWHSIKKIWYGYATTEEATEAIENALKGVKVTKTTKTDSKPVKTAEKVNKFGVEVGDVFYLNWGYDQTNVDFFQVTELVGTSSVMVKHVNPKIVKTETNAPMCADYTYNITKEPMPIDTCGVFVKNSEKGDLKRINCREGGTPYINFDKHYYAHKIPFGERKEYVSWYA